MLQRSRYERGNEQLSSYCLVSIALPALDSFTNNSIITIHTSENDVVAQIASVRLHRGESNCHTDFVIFSRRGDGLHLGRFHSELRLRIRVLHQRVLYEQRIGCGSFDIDAVHVDVNVRTTFELLKWTSE